MTTTPRSPRTLAAGRFARGVVATIALCVLALLALLGLTWSCCSSPSAAERWSSPFVLGAVLSLPVPIAAFPPVSRRLRGSERRWMLAPFVLAAFLYCSLVAFEVTRAVFTEYSTSETWILGLGVLLPTLVCAVYVSVRVLRRAGERGDAARDPTPGA